MSSEILKCCVCGITIPNRYAVGGTCCEAGCGAVFCSLHAVPGARCPAHGGGRKGRVALDSPKSSPTMISTNEDSPETGDKEKRGKVMEQIDKGRELARQASKAAGLRAKDEALKILKKLGSGTKSLMERLKHDRSPEAALDTMNRQKEENASRRRGVSEQLEVLYNGIVRKKKERAQAAPVRQRTIDMELKNMLAEYQGLERQLAVYLENERVLEQVKGRFLECLAYDLRKVDENRIDDIAGDLDDRVDAAESTLDAVADLERAGRRKDRDGGDFDLEAELAGFGEESSEVGVQSSEGASADSEKDSEDEKIMNYEL